MARRFLTGSFTFLLAMGLLLGAGAEAAHAGGLSLKKAFRSAEKRVKKSRDRVRKHAKRASRSIEKRAKAARDTVRFGFRGTAAKTRTVAAKAPQRAKAAAKVFDPAPCSGGC